MLPDLSAALIQHQIGDTYYARGRRYARQGQVLHFDLSTTDFGWVVRSEVSGTRRYSQQIDLLEYAGDITIDGECSCPVAYNCKHVAAVLVAMLEQQSVPPVDAQQAWLERLEKSGAADSWPVPRGGQALLYVLGFGDPQNPAGLTVEVRQARLLMRSDSFGKARVISSYEFSRHRYSDIAQPVDREVLRLLEPSAGIGYSQSRLYGASGALALRRMMDSGRLFYASTDRPALRRGDPRRLSLEWRNEDGYLRLVADTDPPGGLILPLDPPMYLDIAPGLMGPLAVDEGLNHRHLSAMLDAPPLPVAEAQRLSARLMQRLPHLPLPLPLSLPQLVVRELLVPVLRLHGLGSGTLPDGPASQPAAVLSLSFAYGGHRLPPPPAALSRVVTDTTLFQIERDAGSEQAALDRLTSLDLHPCENTHADAQGFALAAAGRMQLAQQWRRLLEEQVPRLQTEGWLIERDAASGLDFVSAERIEADIDDQGGWFDLQLGIELDGARVDLVPLLAELVARLEGPEALPDDEELLLELNDARWLAIPAARIKPLLSNLFDLFSQAAPDRAGLRLRRMDAVRLGALEGLVSEWHGGAALRELGQRLSRLDGIPGVAPPSGLQAELRPYQQRGLDWLQFLRETGFGGILADDMGLGKTLQALAHLLLEKQAGRLDRPALIVAPTSLMANWRHEAARFAPALSVLTLQGPGRKSRFAAVPEHDLVLSTYPLLPRDREQLLAYRFHSVILDEAQTIKNPRSRVAQVAGELQAEHRLCLSGTPMENHLGELWSLFHFLAPGYLGDQRQFQRLFRTPIELHGDPERREALQRRTAPFLLRRTKQQVAGELPEKSSIIRTVTLSGGQAELYESVRAAMDRKIRDSLSNKGLARSHITILDALLKLRQICCDPRLVKLPQAKRTASSAKLELLLEMVPELLAEGRRILLFSQFTSMLALIGEGLDGLGIRYSKLTGQTRRREAAIGRFRSGEVPLFLISLKAGGVGLNLTEADTVIHYDPWWNPAVENQATDRAHRIGQQNKVFVYKLVTEHTVEEKILALQARKAALADALYRKGGAENGLRFDEDDLRELLRPIE